MSIAGVAQLAANLDQVRGHATTTRRRRISNVVWVELRGPVIAPPIGV